MSTTFMDRRFVTFLLFCVAFYVMTQIMNQGSNKENMENEQVQPQSLEMPNMPAEVFNVPSTPMPAAASEEIYSPIGGQPNLQELQGLSQVENRYQAPALGEHNYPTEQILYQAPGEVSNGTGLSFQQAAGQQEQEANFYPDPVDTDITFNHSGMVRPQDLIPSPDGPVLFSEYQEQPSLNQNFLQTRFSVGISTTKEKRNSNLDLRGAPATTVPLSIVSPWNMPTTITDFYRKTLADVS